MQNIANAGPCLARATKHNIACVYNNLRVPYLLVPSQTGFSALFGGIGSLPSVGSCPILPRRRVGAYSRSIPAAIASARDSIISSINRINSLRKFATRFMRDRLNSARRPPVECEQIFNDATFALVGGKWKRHECLHSENAMRAPLLRTCGVVRTILDSW